MIQLIIFVLTTFFVIQHQRTVISRKCGGYEADVETLNGEIAILKDEIEKLEGINSTARKRLKELEVRPRVFVVRSLKNNYI